MCLKRSRAKIVPTTSIEKFLLILINLFSDFEIYLNIIIENFFFSFLTDTSQLFEKYSLIEDVVNLLKTK